MPNVEKHDINEGSVEYAEADRVSYLSKNVYNSALYFVRRRFFEHDIYTPFAKLVWLFSQDDQFDYRQLPSKVAQQTMKVCDRNVKSFFKSIKDWKEHPEKYKACPQLPKYLDSVKGRFVTVWTIQAISKKNYDRTGNLYLSGSSLKVKTKARWSQIQQVRLVPKTGKYVIEVVYETTDVQLKEPNGNAAGADLGVDNLITLTTNIPGTEPVIMDGKELKSINQYFNKRIANEKEKLAKKHKDRKRSSRKLRSLYRKRENRIDWYLHKASRMVVNHLASLDVTELYIGHNDGWKQDIDIGDRNNQNFSYIPFDRLINMLIYKCARAGITARKVEESYTSKASFLDLDELPEYRKPKDGEAAPKHTFSGYRKHRGLYIRKIVKDGSARINADVNGSYNIIRKGKPTAFRANGVAGVVVRPVRYRICETKSGKHGQLH